MNDQKFKADAGKAMPDLLEMGFPRALRLVQATLEYGAQKYEAHSWRNVPDAMARYNRAGRRHRQDRDLVAIPENGFYAVLEACDAESGIPHIAHEIFNLLCMIELDLQAFHNEGGDLDMLMAKLTAFKQPPTAHKEPSYPAGYREHALEQLDKQFPPAATIQAREKDAKYDDNCGRGVR